MELPDSSDTRLQEIFREVLEMPSLILTDELTAKDVENWDSLNHIQLLAAIEREFKVKFTTSEIVSLKNVGELKGLIQKKLAR